MPIPYYTESMINEFKTNLDFIKETAKRLENVKTEPTIDQYSEVIKYVNDYVIKNKLLIYGGHALQYLLKEPIYDDKIDMHDVDFYSSTPYAHLINIADHLYKQGSTNVTVKEGIHANTFKLRIGNVEICDSSYVPPNILNHIPYILINKIRCVHPEFMIVDYFRIFTDFTSYWRIDKTFNKLTLIQKEYPYPDVNKVINKNISLPANTQNLIFNICKTYTNVVYIGQYAYNHYMSHDPTNLTYIEILSNNLNEIVQEMIKKNFTVKRYYPFFQFTGPFVEIYDKNRLIFKIYTTNDYCVPYILKSDKKIATFSVLFVYLHIQYLYYKIVNRHINTRDLYHYLASSLLKRRANIINKKGKSLIYDEMFTDFNMKQCTGDAINAQTAKLNIIHDRLSRGVRVSYIYDPERKVNDFYKNGQPVYKYSMINGKLINNE